MENSWVNSQELYLDLLQKDLFFKKKKKKARKEKIKGLSNSVLENYHDQTNKQTNPPLIL